MRNACLLTFLSLFTVSVLAANLCQNGDFETGTLSGWTTPFQGSFRVVQGEAPHSGQHFLEATGGPHRDGSGWAYLVQSLTRAPVPGVRYRLTGWLRGQVSSGQGKWAALAVRQISSSGATLGFHTAAAELSPTEWRRAARTFTIAEGTATLQVMVVLADCEASDWLAVDDIAVEAVDEIPIPIRAAPAPFSGGTDRKWREPATWTLRGRDFDARVDQRSGLLVSLTCLSPTPLTVHPAAEDTTRVFVQMGDREVLLIRPVEGPTRYGARGAQEVTVLLAPAAPDVPLQARVTHRMTTDSYQERVVVSATGELGQLARIGVRHGFVPEQWQRLVCGLRPLRVSAPDAVSVFSNGERAGFFARNRLEAGQTPNLPLTVLEAKDRYLLVGDPCIDRFVTIAPNEPAGYMPSVQLNPRQLRAGEDLTFVLSYRVFPRRDNLLRDVWRSYAERAQAESPLLEGCTPYRDRYPPRTVPAGCLLDGAAYFSSDGPSGDLLGLLPTPSIWACGWHDRVNERYPTDGTWWAQGRGWKRVSAPQLRENIRVSQSGGAKWYLCFGGAANLARVGKDLPAGWVEGMPGGENGAADRAERIPLPPEVQRDAGVNAILRGAYDFGNEDLRTRYLEQLRTCVTYYRPAGIAWDMGWSPSAPGRLTVQAAARSWLRDEYPDTWVIGAEAFGTPSQWFCDAVIIEDGIAGGKSVDDYEIARACGTHIFTGEHGSIFVDLARRLLQGPGGGGYGAGLADAKRYADWLRSRGDLPGTKERVGELGARLLMRAGLRDLGLGSSWAFPEHLTRHFGKPLPSPLVEFMTALPALPTVTRSFALRVNGKPDRDGDLYAAAWCGRRSLRVAVFNDGAAERTAEVALRTDTLREHGWIRDPRARTTAFVVDTSTKVSEATPREQLRRLELSLLVSVPGFSLLAWSADVSE